MKPEKALTKIIELHFDGNTSKLARALNIRPQAVHKWKKVPLDRVYAVSDLTGLPPFKIRPDFFRKTVT